MTQSSTVKVSLTLRQQTKSYGTHKNNAEEVRNETLR